VYALSIPGVQPSTCITWFQANQACLLSGKRLLTNREWQGRRPAHRTRARTTGRRTATSGILPRPTPARGRTVSRRGACSTWWGTSMSG
jgi:hypothetical protein